MTKLSRNHDEINDAIDNVVKKEFDGKVVEGKHRSVVFSNVRGEPVKNTFSLLSEATKNAGSITRKYKADVSMVDKDGNVIESKKGIYIGDIPIATKKGGFIVDGSSYVIPHQMRLKPGAYTLNKQNGDVETMLNLNGAKSLKIISPRDKDSVHVQVGGQTFNPIDVAKILGASESEIKKKLGSNLYKNLSEKSDEKSTAIKLANNLGLIGPDISPPHEEVVNIIKEHYSGGKMDPSSTKHTLGKPISTFGKDALLESVRKNVMVKRGEIAQDDKENLMFKKVVLPEHLLGEGISRSLKKEEYKMKNKMSNLLKKPSLSDVVNKPLLRDASRSFMTTSAISRRPEEYNPLQSLQVMHDITPMGEGGISSKDMITPEVRSMHMSQLGFIDPIKSPEGANTGITLSVTHGSHVDDDGNPAVEVKNLKTGKKEIKTVAELWDKKIAFPDVKRNGEVGIRHRDSISVGKINHADYQIDSAENMYGPAMNSLGAISANDPTRNMMASKHSTQALPLVDRDVNPVSLMSKDGKSNLETIAKKHLAVSSIDGEIHSVDEKKGLIKVKGKDGKVVEVDYAKEPIQLNTKTFLKHDVVVKKGDKVKAGQHLTDSNFTKGGELAIGKNLRTAWAMYPGTRNDAFVISDTAAKKLTSMHSEKFDADTNGDAIFDKRKFANMFPEVAKKLDMSKYDDNGFVKEGVVLNKDEPIYLGMRKMDPSEAKFSNDKIKKLMYGGFVPVMEKWKSENPGTVDTIGKKGGNVRVAVSYTAPLQKGDKIAGRSGNKGIVSAVVPESEMPRDENGRPIELFLGGAGVISRQNPAQIIEATLTETAKKTGKKYVLPHYVDGSLRDFAKNEAKNNNVQLYHKVYDPVRKKHLDEKVFVADYNIMKLFKQGESANSGVGVGATDMLDQPMKGGKNSAASLSNMEINALLSHDARDFLREAGSIRSQKNKEWFAKFEAGEQPPAPEEKTARKHFGSLLKQMNINLVEDGKRKKLIPMTDKDVVKLSVGEVKEPFGLKRNTLEPVKGGFYDPKIFGQGGNFYGHIDTGIKLINPIYKKQVAALLGTTESGLDKTIAENGTEHVYNEATKIKSSDKIKELKEKIKNTKDSSKIDRMMKTVKMLKKLESENKNISDVGFISKIPVLPTQFRMPGRLPNGAISEHDVNHHYSEIVRMSNTLKEGKNKGVDEKHLNALSFDLQKSVGALYGTNESPSDKLRKMGTKSMMDIVAGDNPKTSFWHQKVLKNKTFTSGRAVIVPHLKSLSMDEVELPKDVAWKIFEPHVTRKMSQMGIPVQDSKEHIRNRTPTASNVLSSVMKEVPVVVNRPPSLHKHNMTGHYAKIGSGNVMHLPPEVENGHNADYDGDQLAIHVPLTQKSIHDVKSKLMASKQLFSEKQKGKLIMGIDLDPFIGFYDATKK